MLDYLDLFALFCAMRYTRCLSASSFGYTMLRPLISTQVRSDWSTMMTRLIMPMTAAGPSHSRVIVEPSDSAVIGSSL